MDDSPKKIPAIPAAALTARRGFAVRLEGAALFDLIQLECLQRSRKAVRVRSGTRTGHLFFRGGNLVHATSGALEGETAVREILHWPAGVYETARSGEGDWPGRETIALPWQVVLLRAVQADDDEARDPQANPAAKGPSKILSFPSPEGATAPGEHEVKTTSGPFDQRRRPDGRETLAWNEGELARRSPIAGGVANAARAPETIVRLAADGRLLGGNAAPELAEAVAYAAQLGDLLGELLGAGPFISMEVSSTSDAACVVRRQPNGDLAAIKAPAPADLEALQRRLGTAR